MTETILITKEALIVFAAGCYNTGAKFHNDVSKMDRKEQLRMVMEFYEELEDQLKENALEVTDGQQN